ncbi:MAG: glycosyltransferase family 2 protein, partial [Chthoniobacterales bacterium]
DWNLKLRRLRLSGWCIAKKGAPPAAIRARVGGRIFDGRFDRKRADAVAYVGLPDAPRWCGFTVDAEIRFGRKRLELQVAANDGRWHKAFARTVCGPLLVSAAERKLWQQIDEADAQRRYVLSFSRPADWAKPARILYLAGWCVDRTGAGIQGMRAIVGARVFSGNAGIDRPDVAASFPDVKGARRSGFAIKVDVPRGKSCLALQAKGADGVWRQIFSREITGGAGEEDEVLSAEEAPYFGSPAETTPRFQFWFDRPADWSGRVRHLQISGWCVAISGPPIAEMRARIRGKVFRANYGILRPDVAVHFGSDSPALRSGFSMDVIVPWSWSTLVCEARSSGGPWEPFFRQRLRGPLFWSRRHTHEPVGNYAEWIALHDRVTRDDRARIRGHIAEFPKRPLFSIILPVYNSDAKWLRRAILSVREQLYPHWELCMVDDASTAPHVWPLLQAAAQRDSRIKILRRNQNGHICAASNDALAMATGEFIALLDHDDELAPTALYFAARELNLSPGLQLIYSDEDKLDPRGRRCDPYFKPDWNPDLVTSQNYISHLSIYSAELVRKVGGFRVGFEGSQDYDLTLRCAEKIQPEQIRHIPHVLYHWRIAEQSTATFAAAKPYAHAAAVRAVQEHIDHGVPGGRVVPHYADYLRVIYSPPPENPLVSIIIPTRDRLALLRQCIESLTTKTDYPNFEIIIIDNESRDPETEEYLSAMAKTEKIEILRAPGPFNFSKLNNVGVAQARGTFVALLNNDLEVMNREWLTEMISHAARPGVGAVGARLWYPDGRLQHGGVLLGVGGVATHAHRLLRKEHGYFARARLTQNYSAVTGACMVLRKEVYRAVGGFDEMNLPVAFNDVDFCLRLRERGLRIVWTPHAELIHHESASRGFEDTGQKQLRFMSEVEWMQKRWGHLLEADPYYNPNLSIAIDQQFKLAFPPRIQKPWKEVRI